MHKTLGRSDWKIRNKQYVFRCVFCWVVAEREKFFRYFAQNFDWLHEQLGEVEDDYIFFDCPGQIDSSSKIDSHPSWHQWFQYCSRGISNP